ncbi:MAG: 2-oxoacid:acceptor oxidoreductase family protein [Bacteroidia bacterium]|nr:2-oxoacid:acceptor oxidoreductase family protein [Bacteroidia bacterium]
MTQEIIIAGFGGQGVLSMGKILAYSGMMQGEEVSWMPSYGPEMRGGTANVTVILSDDRISSPYLKLYDTAIILNQQSLDKFESTIKPGGVLIYDPQGITHHPSRTDIDIYQMEGHKLATEMGNRKVFNMIVLGAFLKIKPIVDLDNVMEGLKRSLPERYHHLLPLNEDAIRKGMKSVIDYKSENQLMSEQH